MTDFERKVWEKIQVHFFPESSENILTNKHAVAHFARAIREIVGEECAKECNEFMYSDNAAEAIRALTKGE